LNDSDLGLDEPLPVLPRTAFDDNLQKVMEKHKEKLKEDSTSSLEISGEEKKNLSSSLYLTPPSLSKENPKKLTKSTKPKISNTPEEKEPGPLETAETIDSSSSSFRELRISLLFFSLFSFFFVQFFNFLFCSPF
jgi:hypothetical protein